MNDWTKQALSRGLGLLLVVMCAACVRPQVDPETALRQRVSVFWQAREAGNQTLPVNGKKRTLYDEFLCAADKMKLTESEFAKRTSMKVRNVRILEVQLAGTMENGTRATVTISFDTPAKFGAWFNGVRVKQDWVLEHGKWMVVMGVARDPFRRKLL